MNKKAKTLFQILDRARFSRCWRTIGATSDSAFDVVLKGYAEPHRFYHNENHILECLAWLDQFRGLAKRPAELEVAIFFHDLVYKPVAKDNEARSADLFRRLARESGIANGPIERISGLIKLTANHTDEAQDAALMNDIDLSILGAPPYRYLRYEDDVRLEFSTIDDKHYKAGRALVLSGFLERICIYQTPEFEALLEVQARKNITSALPTYRHQT